MKTVMSNASQKKKLSPANSYCDLKSRSTEKHEVRGPKAVLFYVHWLFFFRFLSKSYGFLASNFKFFC